MRYRLLASYQGAPYEAGIGPGESGVVLFAACPPPEELHFEPATGHWRKAVRRRDVQSLYESRPVGLFRGERCVVLDDLGDRLHIAYLGHDALKADQLGYWEVDRGVFELIAPRQQVSEIVEERLPVTEGGRSGDSESYGPNGHRAALLPAGPGHTWFADDPDPLAGPSVPRSPGLPGYGRGDSGADLLGPAGPVAVPPADAPPLPLEAAAMRAAAEATRRAKGPHQEQPSASADSAAVTPGSVEPKTPVIPVTPSGLSEPSVPQRAPDAAASAVPSWTPPAQRPGPGPGAGKAREADAAHEPDAPAAASSDPPDKPARPDLGHSGQSTATRYGEPGTAASNGTHGRAARQAVAEAPPLDPYHLDQTEPPDTEPPPESARTDRPTATALSPGAARPSIPARAPGAGAATRAPWPASADGISEMPAAASGAGAAVTTATPVPAPTTPREPALAARPGPAATYAPPLAAVPETNLTPVPGPKAAEPGQSPATAEVASPSMRGESRASRRRRSARRRIPTQRIFSELADQAGIRPQAYAIGEDIDGAMCLVQTPDGFEVFNSLGGARHEVRMFADEESAYFYLFGVLAAEAVRTGTLGVAGPQA